MLAKEISVKRYVVRPSGEERERLETLLRKGKSPARRLLKARILLKADVSEAGEGWSDSRIIKALETSVSMIYRVRKQLVEEGFEAVLSRKQRATPAVARIFDGEKEAKLIALACSKPPKGRARWTQNDYDSRDESAAAPGTSAGWANVGGARLRYPNAVVSARHKGMLLSPNLCAAARPCPQFLSRPPAPHGSPNTSAATTVQIDAFCGSAGGRGVSPTASLRFRTRPKGPRCSKPNTTACLASAPALPHPSGKKPLDVVQHYLVIIGFREDRTVLTKLTRSVGCALRGASKDNVQLRPH